MFIKTCHVCTRLLIFDVSIHYSRVSFYCSRDFSRDRAMRNEKDLLTIANKYNYLIIEVTDASTLGMLFVWCGRRRYSPTELNLNPNANLNPNPDPGFIPTPFDLLGVAEGDVAQMLQDALHFDTKELQGTGSFGLGLILSHGYLIAHGGELWMKSQGVGKGRTVAFGLPLTKQSSQDMKGKHNTT